jgi:hypothetical protein
MLKLSGSVVRLGSQGGFPLLGVRLRASVCLRSRSEALSTFPDTFGITHFAVVTIRSRRQWWPVRTVVDRPHWLVPFGETWPGACGEVLVEDAIPPEQYVTESLGNQNSCYGVALTIRAGASRATRRIIVGCGGLNRLTYRAGRGSN